MAWVGNLAPTLQVLLLDRCPADSVDVHGAIGKSPGAVKTRDVRAVLIHNMCPNNGYGIGLDRRAWDRDSRGIPLDRSWGSILRVRRTECLSILSKGDNIFSDR